MTMLLTGTSGNRSVVNFGNLKFWAERGLIHIEDIRDGAYEVISVRSALHRMKAISDMLGNSVSAREKHSYDQFDYDNVKRHQDMLDGLKILCDRAKVQGMPTDPSARRANARALPKTFVVPGRNSMM